MVKIADADKLLLRQHITDSRCCPDSSISHAICTKINQKQKLNRWHEACLVKSIFEF